MERLAKLVSRDGDDHVIQALTGVSEKAQRLQVDFLEIAPDFQILNCVEILSHPKLGKVSKIIIMLLAL